MKKQNYILGIDIGNSKICSLVADICGKEPQILGVGIAHSHGIQKGNIKSIDSVATALQKSLDEARQMAGVEVSRAFIALSGNSARSENIRAMINLVPNLELGFSEAINLLPNCEISFKEINRLMQLVDFKARNEIIPSGFELVHILPHSFIIDNQKPVNNPLGMVGSRLEVSARVVYAHKADLANLRKVAQIAGLEIAGFVLGSYASAIAVLSDDEKELGACCIDMGSGMCNFMIHHSNSMCYEDCLPSGSWNVTNDIATELSTAMETAELIKKDFATLSDLSADEKQMVLERVPTRSGETRNIEYEALHSIVFSRVLEMLQRIEQSIKKSDLQKKLGAGIVITGGLSCMRGLQEVAQKVFAKLPVRIAMPKEINKSFGIIRKVGEQKGLPYACFSTAIGLILYAFGESAHCELDANGKIKFK